jgi:hypothetical protein
MGGACGMHKGKESYMQGFGGVSLRERGHL